MQWDMINCSCHVGHTALCLANDK